MKNYMTNIQVFILDSDENDTHLTDSSVSETDKGASTVIGSSTETAVAEPIVTGENAQDDDYVLAYSSAPQNNGTSDADIVKSDEQSLYYIVGNTVYISSLDSLKVTAKMKKLIVHRLNCIKAKTILISRKTESA